MEFKRDYEVDKGPVIRWFADQAVSLAGWLWRTAGPYATMYTVVFDEDELED